MTIIQKCFNQNAVGCLATQHYTVYSIVPVRGYLLKFLLQVLKYMPGTITVDSLCFELSEYTNSYSLPHILWRQVSNTIWIVPSLQMPNYLLLLQPQLLLHHHYWCCNEFASSTNRQIDNTLLYCCYLLQKLKDTMAYYIHYPSRLVISHHCHHLQPGGGLWGRDRERYESISHIYEGHRVFMLSDWVLVGQRGPCDNTQRWLHSVFKP